MASLPLLILVALFNQNSIDIDLLKVSQCVECCPGFHRYYASDRKTA